MTRSVHVLAAAVLLSLAACAGGESERAAPDAAARAEPPLPAAVQQAVTVANAIDANPAATDSILQAHGLTRAGLDSLMYAIAADSALAAAYERARR